MHTFRGLCGSISQNNKVGDLTKGLKDGAQLGFVDVAGNVANKKLDCIRIFNTSSAERAESSARLTKRLLRGLSE